MNFNVNWLKIRITWLLDGKKIEIKFKKTEIKGDGRIILKRKKQ